MMRYWKLAIRNFKKRSLFTFINISGLAVGLASVLIIVSYINDELSYDRFHRKHDRLYRITLDWFDDGKQSHLAAAEPPLAEVLPGKLSGIEGFVRVFPLPALVSIDKVHKVRETKFCFADSLFFDFFDFQFLYGDENTALDDPMSVVLTKSKAIEYFGTDNAVGKDIHYENDRESFTFHVTGVIKDFPTQSHFKADFLASFQSMNKVMPWYDSWYYPQMPTYLLASPGTNAKELEKRLNEEIKKHYPPQVNSSDRSYYLQEITDIHLYSNLAQEWEPNSSISYVYLFATIAAFVLLIASINFMNLSTAQAATRAKEVGLRKVMGADRKQLIVQFLGEAILITLLAFLIGFALSEWVLLGGMNKLLEKQLSLNFLFSQKWIVVMIGMVLFIGILSGLYPAFFLSRFKPVRTLKGVVDPPGREITLRKGMVIFQFVISGVLIIFTWIVLTQNNFMMNKDLGFDKEHVVAIRLNDSEAQRKYAVLKNSLMASSQVVSAALSSALPGNDEYYGFSIKTAPRDENITISTLGVDEDYLKTYDIKLISGRDFSLANKADESSAFIINQAAASLLGMDDPVGQEITFSRYTSKQEVRKGNIIGLVEDFHFQSLYHKVEPLLIYINRHIYYADYLSVRFKDSSPLQSIDLLKSKWSDFIQDKPLEYVFMDTQLDQYYDSEIKRANVFSAFASLSIIISCLGLFGLAAFSMQQKRKEIGVRKVLGASINSLLKNLSAQFLKLVLIANLIAWPIAWYASDIWLQGFAYRVSPGFSIFLMSLVATAGITLLTVGFQTISAARANCVDTLREE